jgi:hypothetical protein
MTIEQVRNLYSAQPFQPFVIHLADGRNIPVNSREFIMTVPSGRTLVVAEADDRVHLIDLLLVTDLELAAQSNGKRKRRM